MENLKKQLSAEITAEKMGIKHTASQDLKDLFCKNWETAKSVLETFKKLISNKIIIIIIEVLIKAGDIAHGIICK